MATLETKICDQCENKVAFEKSGKMLFHRMMENDIVARRARPYEGRPSRIPIAGSILTYWTNQIMDGIYKKEKFFFSLFCTFALLLENK